jgi:hypothetical protein
MEFEEENLDFELLGIILLGDRLQVAVRDVKRIRSLPTASMRN